MKTDLDSLAIALYVKTYDLLKASPQLALWRPRVGITPRLSDAELVTLAVMQALLGFVSEARLLRHARSHLRHLFPCLPQQSGYNKRLRHAAGLIRSTQRRGIPGVMAIAEAALQRCGHVKSIGHAATISRPVEQATE